MIIIDTYTIINLVTTMQDCDSIKEYLAEIEGRLDRPMTISVQRDIRFSIKQIKDKLHDIQSRGLNKVNELIKTPGRKHHE